ncbi:MAG: YrdB family protein [Acidimicrobiia bacterium]|nr:YrdB family protein [Acidimicrobiia bacterium]
MNAPEMALGNLALRFGLELAALVGLAMGAWASSSGWVRWAAVIVVPVTVAAIWGVFNVVGDPSRSGDAPIEVPGWLRLGIELVVLGGGAGGFYLSERPNFAIGVGALVIVHYGVSVRRVHWLLDR